MSSSSIIDAAEIPRLIQLEPNLYGAAFFVMKLLPARFILDKAEEAGLVPPGSTIIEPRPPRPTWAGTW